MPSYYTALDYALQDARPYRLNTTIDHDEIQVCNFFEVLNQYLNRDPQALQLDPYFTRTALFATQLFEKLDGTPEELLDVREKVYRWKLPLDSGHEDAKQFGPDIDYPKECSHLSASIGEYAVTFPRLLPVLERPVAPVAAPTPPVATILGSPAQTADAPSLSSSQQSWFNQGLGRLHRNLQFSVYAPLLESATAVEPFFPFDGPALPSIFPELPPFFKQLDLWIEQHPDSLHFDPFITCLALAATRLHAHILHHRRADSMVARFRLPLDLMDSRSADFSVRIRDFPMAFARVTQPCANGYALDFPMTRYLPGNFALPRVAASQLAAGAVPWAPAINQFPDPTTSYYAPLIPFILDCVKYFPLQEPCYTHAHFEIFNLFRRLGKWIALHPRSLYFDPFITRIALCASLLFQHLGEPSRTPSLVAPFFLPLYYFDPLTPTYSLPQINLPQEAQSIPAPLENGFAMLFPIARDPEDICVHPYNPDISLPPSPAPSSSVLTPSPSDLEADSEPEPAPEPARGGARRGRGRGGRGGRRGRGGRGRGTSPPAAPVPTPISSATRGTTSSTRSIVYVEVPHAPYKITAPARAPQSVSDGDEDDVAQQLMGSMGLDDLITDDPADPDAVVDDDANPEWVDDADPKGKGKAKDTGRAPPVEKAPAPVTTRSGRTTRSQNSVAPAPPVSNPSPPPPAKVSKKKAHEIPTRPVISTAPIKGFSDKRKAKQKAFLASEDFSAFKTLPKVPGHITHRDLERGDALEISFVCGRCAGLSDKGYTPCKFQQVGIPCVQCQLASARKCTFEYTGPEMQTYLRLQHEPLMAASAEMFISKVQLARSFDQQCLIIGANYQQVSRQAEGAWLDVQNAARRMYNSFLPSVYAPLFENEEVFLKAISLDPEVAVNTMLDTLNTPDPSELLPNVPVSIPSGFPGRPPLPLPEFVEGSSRRGASSAAASAAPDTATDDLMDEGSDC